VSEPDDVVADGAADTAKAGAADRAAVNPAEAPDRAADNPAEAADRAADSSERADAIPLQRPAPPEEEIHVEVAAAPVVDTIETQPAILPEPLVTDDLPTTADRLGPQQPDGEQPADTEQARPADQARLTAPPAGTDQAAETEQAADSSQPAGTERALVALADIASRIGDLAEAAAELSRLRSRDTDLIARLHEDNTKLRNGEIASALNPVVIGMIKLHDQMVSLGALADPASAVGMLHTQLLQIMELTCAVQPFSPVTGEPFDASRHTGTRRIPTTEASADGTVAGTIRAGFARADGSIVRVAEVEVHRLTS
jgi:molecular chaperone GrpE (heat shock protein)